LSAFNIDKLVFNAADAKLNQKGKKVSYKQAEVLVKTMHLKKKEPKKSKSKLSKK
jgi:hypothetical protein